jgi:extracellular factor (EF) 3-hydroxypalmitic acid methyl ester biosynthesis protein
MQGLDRAAGIGELDAAGGAAGPWIGAGGDSEVPLARLEASVERFLRLAEAPPRSPAALLHVTAERMHQFSASILACEEAGLDRVMLLPHLGRLRALHARSPFVKRLQTWPRGYPGDFETVEWLCDAHNRAPAGTIDWAIEECALQSPAAQQHRNKVGLQARAILSSVLARPQARIASIGCGGCRDLSLIQDYIPDDRGRFVLVDADPGALAFARDRLPRLASRCEFVAGTVPRVLSRVLAAGPFDLVVAGGLFDYLPDRWAIATLRAVRRLLAPGGTLLFSNIAAGNPFRPWIEYLGDWTLIERDEDDLRQLGRQAELPVDTLKVFRDSTSLALMVNVTVADQS